MGDNAWVTLATNDSYALGAQVLAHSLKKVNTKYKLVVLITPGVTDCMKEKLAQVFDLVHLVDVLDSKDAANLALLERPELGVTFTKLHCWKLVQFKKCVFLDADTLVIQNSDDLFERDEFSAAPDVGWPDCFNSGVFVFKPSVETFDALIKLAKERGSFDGGDQGLLNTFFENWSLQDSSKRLPFVYNLCSVACYSYLPAFKKFGQNVKIFHFIGNSKPWLQHFDPVSCQVQTPAQDPHLGVFLQFWWNIFFDKVHSTLNAKMGGLAAAYAQITLGVAQTEAQSAFEEKLRKEAWEAGHIDYLGRDSFDNILHKISETLSLKLEVKPSTPEVPKEDTKKDSDKNVKVEGEVATAPTEQIQKAVETLAKVPEVKNDVPSEQTKPTEVKEALESTIKEASASEAAPKAPEVVPKAPEVVPEATEAVPNAPEAVPNAPETVPKTPEAVTCPLTAPSATTEQDKAAEVTKEGSHVELGPAVLVEKQPEVGPAVLVKKDKNEKEKAPELGPGVISTVAICPNLAVAEVFKPPQAAPPAELAKDQVTTPQKDETCVKTGPTEADPVCKLESGQDSSKPIAPACALPQVSNTSQPEPTVKVENAAIQDAKPTETPEAALPKESTQVEPVKNTNTAEVSQPIVDTKSVEAKTENEPAKSAKEQSEPTPKPDEASKPECAKEAVSSKVEELPKQATATESKTECVKETVSEKTDDAAKQTTPAVEQSKTECVKEIMAPKAEDASEHTPKAEPSKTECVKEVVAPKTVDVEQAIPKTPGIIEATPPSSPLSAAATMPEAPITKPETKIPSSDAEKIVPVEVCKKQEQEPSAAPIASVETNVAASCPLPCVENLKIETTIPQTPPACVEKGFEIKSEIKSEDKCPASQDKNAVPTIKQTDACPKEASMKSDAAPVVPESPKEDLKEVAVAENVETVQKPQPDSENKIETAAETDVKKSEKADDKAASVDQATSEPAGDACAESKESKEQVPEQCDKPSEAEKNVKPVESKDAACPAKPAAAGTKKKAAAPTKGKSEGEKKEASGESGPVPPPRKKDPKKTTPTPKPSKPTKK